MSRTTALDLMVTDVREVNEVLQTAVSPAAFELSNPMGKHALAVGLTEPIEVHLRGQIGRAHV